MNLHFRTFRLHPLHAPLFRRCFFAPGRLGRRFALIGYRQYFGLRSFPAVSSVAYRPYRVRCVDRLGPISSTDYPFTSSCSPPHLAVTQLLSVTGVKLRQRGTSTLRCTLTFKRTSAGFSTGKPSAHPPHAQKNPAHSPCTHSACYKPALQCRLL